MPNPTWPGTLPAFVDEDGYSETWETANIETPMDIGEPKIRPRQKGGFRVLEVSITTDEAGAAAFDTFWTTTCKRGSLPFDWVLPRQQTTVTFRFRNPPPRVSVRGEARTISFKLDFRS